MKAGSRTLEWRSRKSWLADIERYAKKVLSLQLARQLKRSNPSGCWSDDMSWLPDSDIVNEFKDRFLNYYFDVKAFHACRPISVRAYYDLGMLGQSESTISEAFRTIFSDINHSRLDAAISEMSHRGCDERGKIYFSCDDVDLVENCGHYLIQGSEYLIALAACLCGQHFSAEDFRLRLRQFGIPTIFEADIPISYVPDPQVDALCRSIIAEWGKQAIDCQFGGADGMCVILHRDLESRHIKGHWHPRRIPDPHALGVAYVTPELGCDHCPNGKLRTNEK